MSDRGSRGETYGTLIAIVIGIALALLIVIL